MSEVDKSTKDALMGAAMAILFTICWTSTAETWTWDWLFYDLLAWVGSMGGLWYFAKQVFIHNSNTKEDESK